MTRQPRLKGATLQELTNMPSYQLIDIEQQLEIHDEICTICISPFEQNDVICKLECQHYFHQSCLHTWLVIRFTCPNCKQSATTTQ